MARLIAAAFLTFGILSSGCAALLANDCIGHSGRGCRGSDALVTASLLVIERAVAEAEPFPPPCEDAPDASGTRPPHK